MIPGASPEYANPWKPLNKLFSGIGAFFPERLDARMARSGPFYIGYMDEFLCPRRRDGRSRKRS